MLTEKQILDRLDNYQLGYYCQFISLGHVYAYLIDCRLNIFKGENDRWAIVSEKLCYSPRAGAIMLDICYFGNCLQNLEHYNQQDINYYSVYPFDNTQFFESIDGEHLKPETTYWKIRDQEVFLNQNIEDYTNAGIETREYEPGLISVEAAARWLVMKHSALLRATDEELYKSLPADLSKIMVLDEWYHRDFNEIDSPITTDDQLRASFELTKLVNAGNPIGDFETFTALFRQQEQVNGQINEQQWQDNRPGSYETWQLLAKVIATWDISLYTPTLSSNTHWKNWPDSGRF